LKRYNIVTTADHLKIMSSSSGGYFNPFVTAAYPPTVLT